MQELLCAADVLITDYSSCMGDFALMKKPAFLYCPDLEDYIQERGFYWDIHSLPFPVSVDEKGFLESIENFDAQRYSIGVEQYLQKLGSYENPNADKKAGEIVLDLLEGRA